MDDDRIDFSALDPKADQLRYERLVRGVLARTRAPTVMDAVGRQGGRLVLLAAGLALLAWVPALTSRTEDGPTAGAPSTDPVAALAELAYGGNTSAAASWFASGSSGDE